jgi:alpha-galactosidase
MKSLAKHTLAAALLAAAAFNTHAADTIKVFFLAGQSNMVGVGRLELGHDGLEDRDGAIGSLRYEVDNDPAKYGHLVDGNGDWVTRSDVWVWSRNGVGKNTNDSTGDLAMTFGRTPGYFGPEVGIGHVLGEHYDEQVVLVKTAWGGKSLYKDFRSPTAVEKRGGTVGAHYTLMVEAMQEALTAIDTRYSGQTIEIEGLFWHQGWNDRAKAIAIAEYEANFNDLITDLSSALSTPDLKVVIGTTSVGEDVDHDPANYNLNHSPESPRRRTQDIVAAQIAIAKGNDDVTVVNTRDFWRDYDGDGGEYSPRDEIEHWNQNGESYYLIGESMGEAMLTLVPKP